MDAIQRYKPDEMIFVVETKADLSIISQEVKGKVEEDLRKYGENFLFLVLFILGLGGVSEIFQTSAKTGEGVEDVFERMVRYLLRKRGTVLPKYVPTFSEWERVKEYQEKWREERKVRKKKCVLQ